jgi:hypothetical protein
VFAVLFVVGFLISGSDAPDYTAADQVWTNWAHDNEVWVTLTGTEFRSGAINDVMRLEFLASVACY